MISESRHFRFERQSWQFEDHSQERVIVDFDPTIRVPVERFERFFKLLHNDARAHKTVKRDSGRSTAASRQRFSRIPVYVYDRLSIQRERWAECSKESPAPYLRF